MTSRKPSGSSRSCSSATGTFTTALRTPWASGGYHKSKFDVDHYNKIRKATDRTARITVSVAICRTFSRLVLLWVIDRQRTVTDRHVKYRLRIDRLEVSCFAGLSCP
jgi:hypothetical protein